jgi:hypothetical protein
MVMQLLAKMWKATKTHSKDADDCAQKDSDMDHLANSLLFELTFDDDAVALKANGDRSKGKSAGMARATPATILKQKKGRH